MEPLRAVRGMNDILPAEMPRWHFVEERFREWAERFGFSEVRPPLLEPTALFVRSIGGATDIVEKEMYTFVDKGEQSLTLRPEGTASLARTFIEHKVYAQEALSKWYYFGPMYRRERPARGRFRQFYQAGVEFYGDPSPFADAEVIRLAYRLLEDLGIRNIEVRLNSIGGATTQSRFRAALLEYLLPLKEELSADSQRRLMSNPLRILDSKDAKDQALTQGAPSILDFLEADDREHFEGVREALSAFETPYVVDPRLVRGLDYYNRSLFEIRIVSDELGAQSALCGGGRYDPLLASLGGPATPAVGFALGVERLLLMLPERELPSRVDVCLIAASPGLRLQSAQLGLRLRECGLRVDHDFRGQSLKSQLRRADRLGARFAFILGENEAQRGVVQVRDLRAHMSEEISTERIEAWARSLAEG